MKVVTFYLLPLSLNTCDALRGFRLSTFSMFRRHLGLQKLSPFCILEDIYVTKVISILYFRRHPCLQKLSPFNILEDIYVYRNYLPSVCLVNVYIYSSWV